MPYSSPEAKECIASLVDVTGALLRGEFEGEAPILIDTECLLSDLARKINTMVVNLKTAENPLLSAEEHAPSVVNHAYNVVELMAQSTDTVLDKSDNVVKSAEQLEGLFSGVNSQSNLEGESTQNIIITLKAAMFDIIASQSYQDVARQKLETLIEDLNQMRDWLFEVLIVLNIRKDGSPENVQKKTEMLREVNQDEAPESLKQDLVDDLLAEYGF